MNWVDWAEKNKYWLAVVVGIMLLWLGQLMIAKSKQAPKNQYEDCNTTISNAILKLQELEAPPPGYERCFIFPVTGQPEYQFRVCRHTGKQEKK